MTWTAGGFWVRRRDRASLGEVTDRSRAGRMATTSSPTASAGIAAAAGAACQALYQWLSTKVLTEPQRQANEGMLRQLASLSGGVVIAPALAGLLLPVAEEVMFRGLVLDALRPHGQLVAIGGSTVAFVAVHAQFLTQGWRMGLATVPPLIALGLICGYLAHSGRLQLAVVAHSAYNCAGAGSLLLPQCPHQPDRRPTGVRRRRRHGGVAIGLDRGAAAVPMRSRGH